MREIDRAEEALLHLLQALPGPEDLRTAEVSLDDAVIDAGTRPSFVVRDAAGKRYFFKLASAEHIAAEELAHAVRTLGRRPTVPSATRELDLGAAGRALGMLQPLVPHENELLPTSPEVWSALQREVLLREHPWEWLLANLDTHVDQYLLIGPDRHPLNIDWDHTLVDLGTTELTRFTKRRVTVAPIRNLLYDHYVRGELELDFEGLKREAKRVGELDDHRLLLLIARYAESLGKSEQEGRALGERFIERKRRVPSMFKHLIASVRLDRMRTRSTRGPVSARIARGLQAEWQRFVVQTLHDRVMRAVFRTKKVALGWWSKARYRRA
jgi:hypothetical protein